MEKSSKNSKNQRNITTIILLIVLILLLAVVAVLVLRLLADREREPTVIEPDYSLVDPDDNADTIPGDDGTAPSVNNGGGSMELIFGDQITVDLAAGKVALNYQNPKESTHAIVVQIIIERGEEQYLVAESGGIKRGYAISELSLNADTAKILAPGVYEGVMRLFAYDPETGERALVDMNIPVDITVQ